MLAVVTGTADHVQRNRSAWDRWAPGYAGAGLRGWAAAGPTWGIWGVPEAQVGSCRPAWPGRHHRTRLRHRLRLGLAGPPRSTAGRPGYLARTSGDSPGTATRFGLRFPLLPRQRRTGPVRRRQLRPGDLRIRRQHLVRSVPLDPRGRAAAAPRRAADLPGQRGAAHLTIPDEDGLPATERLLRPYFGMHRFEWPDDDSVEFHLGHGDMIRLLRRCGLEVEDLLEIRPAPGAIPAPAGHHRVGPAVAVRGGLEGAQNRSGPRASGRRVSGNEAGRCGRPVRPGSTVGTAPSGRPRSPCSTWA